MKKDRTEFKRRRFRLGDRVRLRGYEKAINWGKRKPQEYGFIVNIDGDYILIRPRWWKQDELIERYPGEIEFTPPKRVASERCIAAAEAVYKSAVAAAVTRRDAIVKPAQAECRQVCANAWHQFERAIRR